LSLRMVDFVNHRPNNSIDHPCSEGTVTMTDSSTPLKVFETLHQLLHLFRREIRQNLEQSDSDLTFGELRVLAFIGRTPQCTPSTLVEFSRTDKAQIARTISKLHKKGLIERRQCETDRRRQRLSLSPAGDVIFQKLNKDRATIAAKLLQHCDEPLLDDLLKQLQKARSSAEDAIP